MNRVSQWTLLGVVASVAAAGFAPLTAHAADSSRQKNKNTWRNGAILGGAATLYGLAKHDKTVTILGAAGTAYAAKRYEDDRHSQSQAKHNLETRYHRNTVSGGRRYYWYKGHRYYQNLNDGSRHRVR